MLRVERGLPLSLYSEADFCMKRKHLILVGILLLASFTRLYHLEKYAGFDFDQELAANSAKRILDGKFTLIGQETSVGGIFVGPSYYYLTALLLLTSKGNPEIMFQFQALLGMLTSYLLFLVGERYSTTAGLVASLTYAVSDRFIRIDQSSNPTNGVVFLTALSLWMATSDRFSASLRQVFTSSIAGFATQMHPSGFALVVLPLTLFLETQRKRMSWVILSVASFCFWFIPLLVFDLRHEFLNLRGLLSFTEAVYYPVLFRVLIVMRTTLTAWFRVLLPGSPSPVLIFFSIIGFARLLRGCRKYRSLVLLLVSSPLVFFFYNGPVPDYYLFPSLVGFVLVVSRFVSSWTDGSFTRRLSMFAVLAGLLMINLTSHLNTENPYSLHHKMNVVQFIKSGYEGVPIRVHLDTDYGQATGFGYLFEWVGVNYLFTAQDPDIVISIPQDRSEGGVTYGGIRVRRIGTTQQEPLDG